jgi:hypothetical protein
VDNQHVGATERSGERLADVRDVLRSLLAQEDNLVQALLPLNAIIRKAGPSAAIRQASAPASKPLSERARELVGNVVQLAASGPAVVARPANDVAMAVERAKALSAELEATREAIRALRSPLHELEMDASEAECANRLAEYRAICASIADGLEKLAAAMIKHDDFTRDFAARGLSWSFINPVPVAAIGDDWPYRFSEIGRAIKRTGHATIGPVLSAVREHQPHRLQPRRRGQRPQSSDIRVSAPGVFRTDVTASGAHGSAVKVAAKRSGDNRVKLDVLRQR